MQPKNRHINNHFISAQDNIISFIAHPLDRIGYLIHTIRNKSHEKTIFWQNTKRHDKWAAGLFIRRQGTCLALS